MATSAEIYKRGQFISAQIAANRRIRPYTLYKKYGMHPNYAAFLLRRWRDNNINIVQLQYHAATGYWDVPEGVAIDPTKLRPPAVVEKLVQEFVGAAVIRTPGRNLAAVLGAATGADYALRIDNAARRLFEAMRPTISLVPSRMGAIVINFDDLPESGRERYIRGAMALVGQYSAIVEK